MTDALMVPQKFSKDKVDLIKATVAKGTTDDELAMFLYVCEHTGLDPLIKQIHAVKRFDYKANRDVMSIQTGIDGYRLIADRSGKYAGNDDYEYGPEVNGNPSWARATVHKMIGGQRIAFSASARWSEYAQTKKDGSYTAMWARMPFLMLGKCAEALALRKAFPAELSGLYTDTEMMQADTDIIPTVVSKDAERNALQQKAADMADVVTGEFHEVETKKTPRDYALPADIVGEEPPALEPEPKTSDTTSDKPNRGQRLTMIQDLFGQLKKKDPKNYNGYWESGHVKKHYGAASKSDLTDEQLESYRNELVELLNPQEEKKDVPASSN